MAGALYSGSYRRILPGPLVLPVQELALGAGRLRTTAKTREMAVDATITCCTCTFVKILRTPDDDAMIPCSRVHRSFVIASPRVVGRESVRRQIEAKTLAGREDSAPPSVLSLAPLGRHRYFRHVLESFEPHLMAISQQTLTRGPRAGLRVRNKSRCGVGIKQLALSALRPPHHLHTAQDAGHAPV